MKKRLKNLITGFFLFVGISLGGLGAGIGIQMALGTNSDVPAMVGWGFMTCVGLARWRDYARYKGDTP